MYYTTKLIYEINDLFVIPIINTIVNICFLVRKWVICHNFHLFIIVKLIEGYQITY